MKAFLGLSASVCITIYTALFKPRALDFLFFLSVAPLAVGMVALMFVNQVPFVQLSEWETAKGCCTTGEGN